MILTKRERELAIEAAANALHCCLSVAVQWQQGAPKQRSKAIMMQIAKTAPSVIGDVDAGEDVLRVVHESFASAQSAAKSAEEVRF